MISVLKKVKFRVDINVSLMYYDSTLMKEYEMNKIEFEVEMKRHHDLAKEIADFLGITYQTLSKKKNEAGAYFTKEEMNKLKERWSLSDARFVEIFFTKDV